MPSVNKSRLEKFSVKISFSITINLRVLKMSYEGFRWITKTCKLKKKFKYPVYLIHKKKLCWSQYHSQMSYYIDTILILCRFMFLSPWMTDSDTFFSFPQTTWENKISLREKKKKQKNTNCQFKQWTLEPLTPSFQWEINNDQLLNSLSERFLLIC